jgi:hypothetical protein
VQTNSKTYATGPNIREVWVRRDDGGLEYKPWLIFDVFFTDRALRRIVDFLHVEDARTRVTWQAPPTTDQLKAASTQYGNLVDAPAQIPPRLLAVDEVAFEALPTELVHDRWYTLGDSVGGIGLSKPSSHNQHFADLVVDEGRDILVSPGILCRIPVPYRGKRHYIFQLAEKNLRVKGQVFYKPIGGHLKHTSALDETIERLGLRRKGAVMPQDVSDITFFVPPSRFLEFRTLLLSQIAAAESRLVVPPRRILEEELKEELGPNAASDGICLLTNEEVTLHDH